MVASWIRRLLISLQSRNEYGACGMESDTHTRRFFKVGRLEEISEPGTKVYEAGKRRFLVARWEGKLYAIDDRCTHDNGP
ncbi:MAG: Rieske 2Fe-2S domain-containing protein, partial [Candidatus Obscuribacterales bacterium]|nr:Rieske 2Fe-2S domain-containing protein [Candidatus Obscuribacterales bacterium]